MEDCENELGKEEESIRKSNRHEEILHQKEAEVREHDRKEDRVKRLIANANEKLEKARTQAAEKQAAARKEMEKLAAEYQKLSKERDSINKENDRTNLDIERKEKEVNGLSSCSNSSDSNLDIDGRDEGQFRNGGPQCADRVREAGIPYRSLHCGDATVDAFRVVHGPAIAEAFMISLAFNCAVYGAGAFWEYHWDGPPENGRGFVFTYSERSLQLTFTITFHAPTIRSS